jgi:hypothetical protein
LVYVETDSIDHLGSKWLEEGHPLAHFDPDGLYPIWKRYTNPGDNVPHDLAQPLQKPSRIYEETTARSSDKVPQLPARLSDNATEKLSLLRQKLSTKKNIVLITGAGISTNAGSKLKWIQCAAAT